jgi:hypothetical protein
MTMEADLEENVRRIGDRKIMAIKESIIHGHASRASNSPLIIKFNNFHAHRGAQGGSVDHTANI